MPGWEFDEPNPIKRCSVQVIAATPIPPPAIAAIAAMHGQFKRDLPRKTEQQMVTVQMGGLLPGAPAPALLPEQQLGGVVFDLVAPNGESVRSLSVSPANFMFATTTYTRWPEFWPLAERVMSAVGTRLMSSIPVVGFILEYHDQFRWNGSVPGIDLLTLFRSDSRLLTLDFLEQKDFCHLLAGWLLRIDVPRAAHQIDNVQISLSGATPSDFNSCVCNIVINHRVQFPQPLSLADRVFSQSDNIPSIFSKTMNEQHPRNKKLLRSLILDEMVQRIPGLDDEP